MDRIVVVLSALVLCLAFAQPSIKRDWRQVNVQSGTLSSVQTTFYPRAASFSDGRYVIVYTIRTANSVSRVYARIYTSDGTTGTEFDVDPDSSDINVMSSPTVAVFPDDTFIIAYRWDSGDPTSVWARRFDPNGGPLGSIFRVDQDGGIVVVPKGIELIGYSDKSFAVIYNSVVAGCPYVVFIDALDNFFEQGCIFDPNVSGMTFGASAVLDSTGTFAYVTTETDIPYVHQGVVAPNGGTSLSSYGPVDATRSPTNVAIALTGNNFVTVLYMLGQSLYYAASYVSFGSFSSGTLIGDVLVQDLPPAIISLNDTTVLIAFRANPLSGGDPRLFYRTARLTTPMDSTIELATTSNAGGLLSVLAGFRMVPLTGSDILVVARDELDGATYHQILTFCGNGHIELQEECDGTANCDADCRCMNGLIAYNGVCGLPNVIPVLDCIEATPNGNTLHFSFINEDGIEHQLEYGYQNSFSPTDLAGDRPTRFGVGSTLTYPASPYSVTVPNGIAQMTWLLGSYNLTVTFSVANVAALQCPESPGFVLDIGAIGYIYDGDLFASNFAARYGLSTSRLTTSVVQTQGNPPSKKRQVSYPNAFDVTIIVAPANSTTLEEPSSAEAVRSIVEEFKDSTTREEVATDLLRGYSEAEIKEVTPTPTGVETRGNRYDTSNVTPPTSSSGPGTNPASPPTSVTSPSGNVSSSSILVPSLAFISVVAICL